MTRDSNDLFPISHALSRGTMHLTASTAAAASVADSVAGWLPEGSRKEGEPRKIMPADGQPR